MFSRDQISAYFLGCDLSIPDGPYLSLPCLYQSQCSGLLPGCLLQSCHLLLWQCTLVGIPAVKIKYNTLLKYIVLHPPPQLVLRSEWFTRASTWTSSQFRIGFYMYSSLQCLLKAPLNFQCYCLHAEKWEKKTNWGNVGMKAKHAHTCIIPRSISLTWRLCCRWAPAWACPLGEGCSASRSTPSYTLQPAHWTEWTPSAFALTQAYLERWW